jgi:hypothetical protein
MNCYGTKCQEKKNQAYKAQKFVPVGPDNIRFIKDNTIEKSGLPLFLRLKFVQGGHQD